YIQPEEFRDGKPSQLFGWERLVKECLEKLAANRLLAVVGGPGSGRRTLVTEGVLPQLRVGALPGSAEWRVSPPITPGAEPLADLVRGLAPAADVAQEVARLSKDPAALGALLDAGGAGPALLFLDRFENLFTAEKREQIAPTIDALLALVAG